MTILDRIRRRFGRPAVEQLVEAPGPDPQQLLHFIPGGIGSPVCRTIAWTRYTTHGRSATCPDCRVIVPLYEAQVVLGNR